MQNSKCKICRRVGAKLFLKGERCFSPKCALIKKNYPPGKKGKRRSKALSEYGKELREKQKLRNWYNLRERQFANYVKSALRKRGRVVDAGLFLVRNLESRLDNVVFRMAFSSSRIKARQLVSHGHFLVNDKKVNMPSFGLKKGDRVALNPKSAKKIVFENLQTIFKKYQFPSWIEFNIDKMEGKIIKEPSIEEAAPPAELSSIFEFYSR